MADSVKICCLTLFPESEPAPFNQSPAWQPKEISPGNRRVLGLKDY